MPSPVLALMLEECVCMRMTGSQQRNFWDQGACKDASLVMAGPIADICSSQCCTCDRLLQLHCSLQTVRRLKAYSSSQSMQWLPHFSMPVCNHYASSDCDLEGLT